MHELDPQIGLKFDDSEPYLETIGTSKFKPENHELGPVIPAAGGRKKSIQPFTKEKLIKMKKK